MNKKYSLAILGANGLLGSDLIKYLADEFDVTLITRNNYQNQKGKHFDIFINANGNSRRFWALKNIYQDFEASTVSVYRTIFDFKFLRYIYISSSDVYINHGDDKATLEDSLIDVDCVNVYGFHKYLSEQIIRNTSTDYLILRCSMLLGTNPKKGPFLDIIKGQPLFIRSDSKLQVITTFAVSEIIKILLSSGIKNQIINIGGEGTINFVNIGEHFKFPIRWSKDALKQHYEMNVSKLKSWYKLKVSEDYLKDWLYEQKI